MSPVVATSIALSRVELSQLAQASAAALFRRITPTGTSFDGDVIFSLATGMVAVAEPRAFTVARIGALTADCLARAVARGVFEARNPAVR